MDTGEIIRKMRTDSGISQRDLAFKLEISQSMLAQIERGTKILTVPLAKRLSAILGCTIQDLS